MNITITQGLIKDTHHFLDLIVDSPFVYYDFKNILIWRVGFLERNRDTVVKYELDIVHLYCHLYCFVVMCFPLSFLDKKGRFTCRYSTSHPLWQSTPTLWIHTPISFWWDYSREGIMVDGKDLPFVDERETSWEYCISISPCRSLESSYSVSPFFSPFLFSFQINSCLIPVNLHIPVRPHLQFYLLTKYVVKDQVNT